MKSHFRNIRPISLMNQNITKAIILVISLQSTPQAMDISLSNSIQKIQKTLSENPRQIKNLPAVLIDRWFDIKSFTEITFESYLKESLESYENVLTQEKFDRLIAQYQSRLYIAFRKKLVRDLGELLTITDFKNLSLTSIETSGNLKNATIEIQSKSIPKSIELLMHFNGQKWMVVDIKTEKTKLSEYYRFLFKNITKNLYSLPVLAAQLSQNDYINLEDFSMTPVGELPLDWGSWRKKDQGKPMPYRVEGTSNHYLAARDSGYSVILGKFLHWNPREYPLLTWCWRATHLPPDGNEFINDANDSAVGLYVIFSQNWLRVPKQIKYVWSSTLPLNTVGRRNKMFRPWFFVKESGDENVGHWQFEIVDLEYDHNLKLGGPPANRTIGLGILSDANSTNSYAEGFYADFRAWKRPTSDLHKISDHCGSLREKND